MGSINPPVKALAYSLPEGDSYTIHNATVPLALVHGITGDVPEADADGLVQLDITVKGGRVLRLEASRAGRSPSAAQASSSSSAGDAGGASLSGHREPLCNGTIGSRSSSSRGWREGPSAAGDSSSRSGSRSSSSRGGGAPGIDVRRGMVLPTFVDLHTHIDKGHTCDRSRNPTGSLSGADKSTAADLAFWDLEDVERRMDFSVQCAYAHGTSALRTHLINLVPKQVELTWESFKRLRRKWAGRVELQGVSLVVLSYFRDEASGEKLADTVKANEGVLGCAVCCSEFGGTHDDDWTTCNRDRTQLLDRIFELAASRGLDLDFHVDENGNEEAKGLRCIAEATLRHDFKGTVVCGHCCSLSQQEPAELQRTLALVRAAGILVVSLPLVNEWTQDRDPTGARTPRWRGITCLKELKAAGVPVAVASDNTRDQFYAYGDLDMLEVFTQSVRLGHLDRPSVGSWPKVVTSMPATAMGLRGRHGVVRAGARANLVLFRARNYGELLSRSQHDRVVVRDGRPLLHGCPDYSTLDPLDTASSAPQLLETASDPVSAAAASSNGASAAAAAAAVASLRCDKGVAENGDEEKAEGPFTPQVPPQKPQLLSNGRASAPSFAAAFAGSLGVAWGAHPVPRG